MKREEEEEVEEEERVMAEDGEGWKSEEAMREGLGFVCFFFVLLGFWFLGEREREGLGWSRGREREGKANFELCCVVSSDGGSLYFPRDSAFYVFAAGVTARRRFNSV